MHPHDKTLRDMEENLPEWSSYGAISPQIVATSAFAPQISTRTSCSDEYPLRINTSRRAYQLYLSNHGSINLGALFQIAEEGNE